MYYEDLVRVRKIYTDNLSLSKLKNNDVHLSLSYFTFSP